MSLRRLDAAKLCASCFVCGDLCSILNAVWTIMLFNEIKAILLCANLLNVSLFSLCPIILFDLETLGKDKFMY